MQNVIIVSWKLSFYVAYKQDISMIPKAKRCHPSGGPYILYVFPSLPKGLVQPPPQVRIGLTYRPTPL